MYDCTCDCTRRGWPAACLSAVLRGCDASQPAGSRQPAACLLLAAAACLRPMLASSQRSHGWLAGWLMAAGWWRGAAMQAMDASWLLAAAGWLLLLLRPCDACARRSSGAAASSQAARRTARCRPLRCHISSSSLKTAVCSAAGSLLAAREKC